MIRIEIWMDDAQSEPTEGRIAWSGSLSQYPQAGDVLRLDSWDDDISFELTVKSSMLVLDEDRVEVTVEHDEFLWDLLPNPHARTANVPDEETA